MAPTRSMYAGLVTAFLAAIDLAGAQQPGSGTPEVHPKLPTWKCTTSGGCVQQDTTVVLDWNYRWIHTNASASCTTASGVNSTLCPDEATCAKNCVIEGATYASSGVTTSADSMTMNQYVKGTDGSTSSASPRVYLLGPDGNYVLMKLLGQELSFEVDLSTTPCGENAALYFSEMDATGGRNEYNTGGANYGSGYCDAQCPVQTWQNGTLNTAHSGYCCNEMDILEANAYANSFTPHPCANGDCDKNGMSPLRTSSLSISDSLLRLRLQPLRPRLQKLLGTRRNPRHLQTIHSCNPIHHQRRHHDRHPLANHQVLHPERRQGPQRRVIRRHHPGIRM